MKPHFIIALMLFGYAASAQITTPIVKANFGIEGDLSSNYFNSTSQITTDDWFSNGNPGSGKSVIDTTGAATIVATYSTNPATRMWSFSRLMNQAPYSVVNNNLLLDAIFHRDYHGDDSTTFGLGSNKNGMSPVNWNSPTSQGVPDKNEILDAYTHIRRAGTHTTDSLWMFNGISIENTTGSRYFDFELYQTDIYFDKTTRSFQNYGPAYGHTVWTFDNTGKILSPGDIIFTAEFGTSGIQLVEARIWVNKSSLKLTPATFNWGGQFDGAAAKSTYGYANILPKTAGDFYTGIQNTQPEWAGPFALVRTDNSVVNNYTTGQFMEFSVNLTKLGIEPASFSNNNCGSPFRRVLIKTRASTSFTSELKDFIAPFSMFNYPKVQAYAPVFYFCGTMPVTALSAYNPVSNFTYSWSTPDGHIVGLSTGPTVLVDAPGKYYVSQQLSTECPAYSVDSITVIFDPQCKTLDVSVTKFDALASGEKTAINWQVDNNQLTDKHTIQYSYDNKVFHQLVAMPSLNKDGITTYSYNYEPGNTQPVFYRVKIENKRGAVKYSKTVLVSGRATKNNQPVIYPNPTEGSAWMAIQLTRAQRIDVYLYDASNRLVGKMVKELAQGHNTTDIELLENKPAGIYFIKVKSTEGEYFQKIILKK